MSEKKGNKESKKNTSQVKANSTPQGKGGSEPPSKGPKRTFSEVSESSAEELTIIHQHLEHLTADLKETREKVMSLMNRDEIKDFIPETVESVMKSFTTNIQKLISEKVEEKIKEKNKDLEERMKSLEYEKDSFCLIWFFTSTQQSFSYAGRVFLGWTSTKLG